MTDKIKIEIVSGLYEDFLNYLIENEFYISSIKSTDFGVTLICKSTDYKAIAKTARKFQCTTKVLQRKGAYFLFRYIYYPQPPSGKRKENVMDNKMNKSQSQEEACKNTQNNKTEQVKDAKNSKGAQNKKSK